MGATPKIIKLKRCPFCGGKAKINVVRNRFDGHSWKSYGVLCDKCTIGFSSHQLKTAVKRWNARKIDETEDSFGEVMGDWIRKENGVENA